MTLAQIGDVDLRPQAIHPHALEEIVGDRLVQVHQQPVLGPAGGALGQDLALRRQQRPPGGGAFPGRNGAGQHIVEQLMRLGPGKTEQGAIGTEMDGHDLLASRTERPLNRPGQWQAGPRHGAV
jgi:hypothetical protein